MATRDEICSKIQDFKTRALVEDITGWLLTSGIQNRDPSSPAYGSFNAWYDEGARKYPFAYSEITGYGISTFVYMNRIRTDDALISRAKLAADWLLSTAWDSKYGGFRCRYYHMTNTFNDRVCSFDAGMCLTGLINLHREKKEAKYLEAATKVGLWLVKRMQRDDGSFYAKLDRQSGALIDDPARWSSQSGSYHSKIAIGLLNLFELTEDVVFKQSAIRVCDWSLRLQDSSGRFVTNRETGGTFLHPHCYSTEGLLCAGLVLENEMYIQSALSALRWITRHMIPTGGVPRMYGGDFSEDESVDILAQTIRLWLLALKFHKIRIDDSNLAKAVTHLFHFKSRSEDGHSRGGLLYGHNDEGIWVNHVNSWGTMFAIQALTMYMSYDNDEAFKLLYLI